jgi:hypothetical protein
MQSIPRSKTELLNNRNLLKNKVDANYILAILPDIHDFYINMPFA